jgi:hypothetical protein
MPGSPIAAPGAHKLVPSLKVPGASGMDDSVSEAASMQVGPHARSPECHSKL